MLGAGGLWPRGGARALRPSDQAGLAQERDRHLVVAKFGEADRGRMQLIERPEERIRRNTRGKRVLEIDIALAEHLLDRAAYEERKKALRCLGMLRRTKRGGA